jgi:ERF superfamily protein
MSEQQLALREAEALPVVASDAASIMAVIERAAADPKTDVDKLERLLGMYERIAARQAEQAYSEAMNAAQEEMGPVSQDASNPQTRSKYASFAALDKAIRPIYARHGFSLSFDTGEGAAGDHVRVVCKVAHRSGHSERPHLDMPADGKGAKGGDVMTKTHATMAAVSYAKRGLLKMIFNIAEGEADDDGNRASGGTITEDQAGTIFDLIKRTKADTAKFCKYMGVEAVPDIMAKDFDRAIIALNTTAKKKEAAQ